MKSKAFHSFESKLAYFDDDIDLIEVLRLAVLEGDLTETGSSRLLKHVDPSHHRHIARRRNSDGSRRNTINHLRSSIYSSYIKDAYEEVTEYLRVVLKQASLNGFSAGRLVGEHAFKMDATSVLSLGTWENVCEAVTASVFQSLESERSTLSLLEKVASKLGLDIDKNLVVCALPYLELRHALVHSDGRLNPQYIARHPQIPRKSNGSVDLTFTLITEARQSIHNLVSAYDAEIIEKDLLAQNALMP